MSRKDSYGEAGRDGDREAKIHLGSMEATGDSERRNLQHVNHGARHTEGIHSIQSFSLSFPHPLIHSINMD